MQEVCSYESKYIIGYTIYGICYKSVHFSINITKMNLCTFLFYVYTLCPYLDL